MSTETKRYRLLKDLPNIEAGAIFEWNSTETWSNGPYKGGRYLVSEMPSDKSCTLLFTPDDIENNTEWFELIPEQSKMPLLFRIESLLHSHTEGSLVSKKEVYHLRVNKIFPYGSGEKIVAAIEQALNPTTDTNTVSKEYEPVTVYPDTKFGEPDDTVSKVKELESLLEYYQAEFNANLDKVYTQQEVDAKELNAFREGYKYLRQFNTKMPAYDDIAEGTVLKAFEDYKNTLPENKASTNEVKNFGIWMPDGAAKNIDGSFAVPKDEYKHSASTNEKLRDSREILNNQELKDWEILSVKRLSDNSIWTAGDINMGKTIEKFYKGWNGMEIHYTDGSASLLMEETKN